MDKYTVPTIFTIFGVTGDLAQKKIFPALIDLYTKNLLPEKFFIVGVARRDLNIEEFQQFVLEAIEKKKHYKEDVMSSFIERIKYSQGQFDDEQTYLKTKKLFEDIDVEWGQCSNKLIYLSVPPALYEGILTHIEKSELSAPCDGDMNIQTGWARILIEKPFGKDAQTAQELDALLGKLFKEEQIYRIDHYLAKQTLQNIMAFRFSNTIFEPLWNRKHIQKVEIKLFETSTAEKRGEFYDANGALRDVGQNHILQMLALVAMEQPKSMKCDHVRTARENIFKKLKKVRQDSVSRAQYDGYVDTEGVAKDSQTETFFSLMSYVRNRRWKGVPFHIVSGKGLKEDKVEIVVHFKDETPGSFMSEQYRNQECNKITISIQPQEKISILFWVKVPGFEDKIEPRNLSFDFHEEGLEKIDAYEKVLFDCISGDQTSFISTTEVLYTWKYIMGVRDAIEKTPLKKYKIGTDPERLTFDQ